MRKGTFPILTALFLIVHSLHSEKIATVYGTWTADMSRAIAVGGFNIADSLYVRVGESSFPPRDRRMIPIGTSSYYRALDTLDMSLFDTLSYRYIIMRNGAPQLEEDSLRRTVFISSTSFTVYDTSSCTACVRRMPLFLSSRRLRRNVHVRWEVDLRPAIYQVAAGDTLFDIQGYYHVSNPDSIIPYGVRMNGPATGSWQSWGPTLHLDTTRSMYDDGTHGDIFAGDTIFTRVILASPDSPGIGTKGQVQQTFKFGIRGGDNEGGRGGFGNNHVESIDDSLDTYTILSQWGSMNPVFYRCWDYENHRPRDCTTDVPPEPNIPAESELYQNHPNPFNPTTNISFSLPHTTFVSLKVFDVLGREAATLASDELSAGTHTRTWDATRMTSGVYFYRLQSPSFFKTKRMILLR